MDKIELWANSVAVSTGSFPVDRLDQAITEGEGITWYEAAECIVEPENIDIGYFDWMEGDIENWVNWIKQNFGPKWGELAAQVAKDGY